MTEINPLAPYNVLILDDAEEPSDFGPMTKALLDTLGCKTVFLTSSKEAQRKIQDEYFDIIIIDINLGSGRETDGFELQKALRKTGKVQPIILVTGQEEELQRPIKDYADVFSSGVTFFFDKNQGNFKQLFFEVIKHVDPVRRALFVASKSGMGDESIFIGEEEYKIADLLKDNIKNESVIRQLRDAFYSLLFEMWKSEK
ncbi:hypothetical protein A3K78_09140 [Candidatus Bathyarchaeota archaeon RBG_13_52_12]|nr:MAG: hypothetical protein A3K78_09140 [Candidatus Bathyarchaeota archaeon RBG_13_52_12]